MELDSLDSNRVRYAALELRTAMEALVYERVLIYEAELPEPELATWQPRQVFKVLLEIDPTADKSSSWSMAEESSPGVRCEPMMHIGTERVISTKELKQYYDKLGSYLHAPTVKQVRSDSAPTPDRMRECCRKVLEVIDEVLASTIHTADIKVASTTECFECGTTIICRMPREPGEGREVNCTKCDASYRVEPDEGATVIWKPLQVDIECGNPDCEAEVIVWHREIKQGAIWLCSDCGGHNRLVLGVQFVSKDEIGRDSDKEITKTKNGRPTA